jgi:polyisoprenoid-binding protein YceI
MEHSVLHSRTGSEWRNAEEGATTRCVIRSPFAPLVLSLVALIAGVARWLLQGTKNVYTSFHQRFFVPDPTFDWKVSSQTPLWIGLELIAVMAGFFAAVLVAALWIRSRRKKGKRVTVLRSLQWAAAALPLIVPIAAFVSGPGPENGRLTLPEGANAEAPTAGLEGSLDLPAGTYGVLAQPDITWVNAHIKAGGDEFDARFNGKPEGTWQADPRDFTRPMTAQLSFATDSVETGVDLRSEHARGEYLQAAKYPRISFTLKRLIASRQDGPAAISFRGAGEIELAGGKTEVEVTGSMQALGADKKGALGIGGKPAVQVKAQFTLVLAKTALKPSDYDTPTFPIQVSAVLVAP